MQTTVFRSDNQAANHFFSISTILVLFSEHNLKKIYQRGGDLLKSSKKEHEL